MVPEYILGNWDGGMTSRGVLSQITPYSDLYAPIYGTIMRGKITASKE